MSEKPNEIPEIPSDLPYMRIGTEFQLGDGLRYKVTVSDSGGCSNCCFADCLHGLDMSCNDIQREDGQHIIYRRIPSQIEAVLEKVNAMLATKYSTWAPVPSVLEKIKDFIKSLPDVPTTPEPASQLDAVRKWLAVRRKDYRLRGHHGAASAIARVMGHIDTLPGVPTTTEPTVKCSDNPTVCECDDMADLRAEVEKLRKQLAEAGQSQPTSSHMRAIQGLLEDRDSEIANLKKQLADLQAFKRTAEHGPLNHRLDCIRCNEALHINFNHNGDDGSFSMRGLTDSKALAAATTKGEAFQVALEQITEPHGWMGAYSKAKAALAQFAPPESETMNHTEAMLAVVAGKRVQQQSDQMIYLALSHHGVGVFSLSTGTLLGNYNPSPRNIKATDWIIVESEVRDEA